MPRVTQAHRDKQQARIHAAAEACFARNGFHVTSMGDVIAEVGMSSSTVYRYFPGGKHQLISSVVSLRLGRLVERLKQLREQPSAPGIADAFESALRSLDGDVPSASFNSAARLAVNAWAELPRDPRLRSHVQDHFSQIRSNLLQLATRWYDEGLVRYEPAFVASMIFRQAMGSIAEEVFRGGVDLPEAGLQLERILAA